MARLSKVILVAALVAMLTTAPVLEARPLTDDSSDSMHAVALTHQRQLRILGSIIGFKLCVLKKIISFGLWDCAPRPIVVVQPKPEEPKKDDESPPYNRKQA